MIDEKEIVLIEKVAIKVGMTSLLNHGAASCVYSEGCNGVTQDHLVAFAREVALHCVAALSAEAQPPADGALNTIAAMFHSAEEIEGPDGLAMMVDMSVWNDAMDSFEEIIGDEME